MPKLIKRKPARDARIEALQLLGKWGSLGQAHVLLGGACSCGVAGASMRVDGEASSRWLALLDDVKRTFDSFDELHRTR